MLPVPWFRCFVVILGVTSRVGVLNDFLFHAFRLGVQFGDISDGICLSGLLTMADTKITQQQTTNSNAGLTFDLTQNLLVATHLIQKHLDTESCGSKPELISHALD